MIEVERFDGIMPSIGYTDQVKVYISNSIKKSDEFEVLYKHECSHIWLQHFIRQLTIRTTEKDNFDWKRWAQAVDLEIALHIYDDIDENIINRPFSLLNGGICKKDLEKYKDCVYAEDFYYALLETPLENDSHDGEANKDKEEDKEKDKEEQYSALSEEKKQELIKVAKELVKEAIIEIARQSEVQRFKEESKKFFPRPTLASEIDIHLGRAALARVSSYRRPNRRESEFIKKGTISKPKTPKVLIYLDRSGSFTPEKTRMANDKLNVILNKYRTKIDKDVVFFHDTLFDKEPEGTGGTNYLAVAKDIALNRPTLAVVITDDDGCDEECRNALNKCDTKIIMIPIGCPATKAANIFGAKEFRE